MTPVRRRGVLLQLATEALASVLPGSAERLRSDPSASRAADLFGPRIVSRWVEWLRPQPRAVQIQAIGELADLPADRAREVVEESLRGCCQEGTDADRALALEYLAAIPRCAARGLIFDPVSGGRTLPFWQNPQMPEALLPLLPIDAPPYPPGSEIPGTPYRLLELLHAGPLGPVHRVAVADQPDRPLSVRFCLHRPALEILRRQREQLDLALAAGRGDWPDTVARLVALDLEHATPFLIHELTPGGDLASLAATFRHHNSRNLDAEEVFALIRPLLEGLAPVHRLGLVHGGINAGSVFIDGDRVRLADLGTALALPPPRRLGGEDRPSFSERWAALRGVFRLGRAEDFSPRAEVRALAALWLQALAGDFSRDLSAEAEELLQTLALPAAEAKLLLACLAQDGPRDAREALALATATAEHGRASTEVSAEEIFEARQRRETLLRMLRELRDSHAQLAEAEARLSGMGGDILLAAGIGLAGAVVLGLVLSTPAGVVLPVLGVGLVIRRRGRARQQARQALLTQIEQLAQEFPDEIEAWGGQRALQSPPLVAEMLASVEVDQGGTVAP